MEIACRYDVIANDCSYAWRETVLSDVFFFCTDGRSGYRHGETTFDVRTVLHHRCIDGIAYTGYFVRNNIITIFGRATKKSTDRL